MRIARLKHLYWCLKGSSLAKMDEPHVAKCHQCKPIVVRTFATEKLRDTWASDHLHQMKIMDAGGPAHLPLFAYKQKRIVP